jgi:hypothetical protein
MLWSWDEKNWFKTMQIKPVLIADWNSNFPKVGGGNKKYILQICGGRNI